MSNGLPEMTRRQIRVLIHDAKLENDKATYVAYKWLLDELNRLAPAYADPDIKVKEILSNPKQT